MSNWYYVEGTERRGPVEETELHNIFKQGIIQPDSYVWTKGFANWEKLNSINELEYFLAKEEAVSAPKKNSPEVKFYFDWKNIPLSEEIFFILIGKDRLHKEEEMLGPYSLQELHIAFAQKRISEKTFLYTPGMLYWEHIGAVPALQDLWKVGDHVIRSIEKKSPCLFVIDHETMPVMSIVKRVSGKTITILIGDKYAPGDDLLISLYQGELLKAKNLELKVLKVLPFEQSVECDLSSLDEANRAIVENCGT